MATQVEQIKWVPHTSFLVDGFAFKHPRCRYYFLTHAHSDHTVGLSRGFKCGVIFCSTVTAQLLMHDHKIKRQYVRPLEVGQEVVIDGVGVTPLDANHCPGSVMFLFRIPHCRVKQAGGPREAGPDGGAAATGGLEGNGGGEGSCEPIGVAWGAGQGAGQGGEAGCDSIWQEQVVRGDTTPQGGDAGGEPEANGEESDAEVEEVLGFGKASGRHLGFSGAEPASAGGRLVVPAKDGGCCGAGVGTGMGATTSNGRAGAHEEEDGEESDDDVIMVEEEGVEQQEAGEGEGGGGGKGGQMGAEAKAEEGVGAGASCGGAAECGCASPYKTAEAQLRAGDTYNVLHTGDCRWQPWMREQPGLAGVRVDLLFLDTTYAAPKHTQPPQQEAVDMMVQAMRAELASEPHTLFVVAAYHIGKERAFLGAAEQLGVKVWCTPAKRAVLQLLDLPPRLITLLAADPRDAQLHVSGWGMRPEELQAYLAEYQGLWRRVVGVRPTGWTHRRRGGVSVRREGPVTVLGVPYSEHSSWTDLLDAVSSLRPRRLVPTVNAATPAARRALVDRFAALMDLREDRSRMDVYLAPRVDAGAAAAAAGAEGGGRTGGTGSSRAQFSAADLASVDVEEQRRILQDLQQQRERREQLQRAREQARQRGKRKRGPAAGGQDAGEVGEGVEGDREEERGGKGRKRSRLGKEAGDGKRRGVPAAVREGSGGVGGGGGGAWLSSAQPQAAPQRGPGAAVGGGQVCMDGVEGGGGVSSYVGAASGDEPGTCCRRLAPGTSREPAGTQGAERGAPAGQLPCQLAAAAGGGGIAGGGAKAVVATHGYGGGAKGRGGREGSDASCCDVQAIDLTGDDEDDSDGESGRVGEEGHAAAAARQAGPRAEGGDGPFTPGVGCWGGGPAASVAKLGMPTPAPQQQQRRQSSIQLFFAPLSARK